MEKELTIVTTTVGNEQVARELARDSVREGMAACAQVESAIVSCYVWEDRLEESPEWRISFKTTLKREGPLVAWIRERHPYSVPEILCSRSACANPDYLKWVEGS